jgi:hypothetical protein
MRSISVTTGVLLIVGGAVWILQGLNVAFAPRSSMTGNNQWVTFGTVTVLVGLGLAVRGFRANRDE